MDDCCWQALIGVDIGQVLSFESCAIGVSTVSLLAEDNTNSHGNGKWLFGPTESETLLHVSLYFMHGTWEILVVSGGFGNLPDR